MSERDEVNNYFDGVIEGMARFAWWAEGTQYVGTCGKTLKDAILEVENERSKVLRDIAFN
jgi:hypothetical protein